MRSRAYTFTLNNYTPLEEVEIQGLGCQYLVYGREVGDKGTPHLQGYIYFKSLKSLAQVSKMIPRAHLEKAITCGPAIQYCKKDGDFFESGTQPIGAVGKKCTQKERAERNKQLRDRPLNELVEEGIINIKEVRMLKNARMDLAQEGGSIETDDVKGEWIHGPPGTGKTHTAHSWNPDAYVKAQNKWWDGYTGQQVVILDDLDTPVLGHYLKIWADKWKSYGEVKGGQVALRYTKFIVTSNYTPEELFKEDPVMAAAIRRRFTFSQHLIKYNK